jgi:hypothetical protein
MINANAIVYNEYDGNIACDMINANAIVYNEYDATLRKFFDLPF